MKMITKIFLRLPYFLKQIVFSFISYKTYKERYSGNFKEYISFFFKDSDLSSNTVLITPDKYISLLYDVKTPKTIDKFKVLNKEKLKEKLKEVDYYNNINFDKSLNTSGTSGAALKIPVTKDFLQYKFASFYSFKKLHHCGINKKTGTFIGRVFLPINQKKPPFWIASKYTNQIIFSQYHLNSKNVKLYLKAIKYYNLISLHGYPSTMTNFADLILRNNLQDYARGLNLKNISLGSESLSVHQKRLIEKTFDCRVISFYGQTESVVDIFECEKGSMHINESYSFVELIDNGNGYYRLIGTQLKNEVFPLLRYDTGDLVSYDPNYKCSCGRKSRVIKEIIGRREDSITLFDGRKIGRLDHVFKDSYAIVEAQFIQTEKGKAKLLIVKGKDYEDYDELKIRQNIQEKLGKDFIIKIEYTNKIEKTSNGKLKQVISSL